MVCQLINKNVASILLATFSCFYSFSQVAEKLYQKEFSKINFVFQPSYQSGYLSQNNDGSNYPSIKFNNSFSHQFGFYYDFAQRGNFNFKTGLIAKEFNPLFDINVTNEDLGLSSSGNSILTDINPVNSFIFSIPLKTEYFLPLNSDINLTLGLGLNLNLSTGSGDVITDVSINNGSELKSVFHSTTQQNQITFSTDFSLGLNYNLKFALVQMDFFYNLNVFPYSATGEYKIYNLVNAPDKVGIYNINGNFYGLSLSVSPKKGWLKKRAKK